MGGRFGGKKSTAVPRCPPVQTLLLHSEYSGALVLRVAAPKQRPVGTRGPCTRHQVSTPAAARVFSAGGCLISQFKETASPGSNATRRVPPLYLPSILFQLCSSFPSFLQRLSPHSLFITCIVQKLALF